jgi:hypothetical protein
MEAPMRNPGCRVSANRFNEILNAFNHLSRLASVTVTALALQTDNPERD